ncbi:Uncharacterised protein [Mycobacteroides abscessus subsp. abscessus]|nr:Uncharacterised protein [Mycobacteroides abscessus subsp. abscessus]
MTVMKAMPVWARTVSVTGCRTSVALPAWMAAAVDGASASAVTMPVSSCLAAASLVRRDCTTASALPAATTTMMIAICRATIWPARDQRGAAGQLRITASFCNPPARGVRGELP